MCGLPIEPPRASRSTYRQLPSTFSPMIPPRRQTSLIKSIQLMLHMLGPRWTIYIDTRFQRTLYLDTDIRVVADISEMFDILDRFDIAIAHAHARNRKETKTVWHFQIPDAFPQMNGGVLLFRSSPTVLDLLRAWQRAYHSAGYAKDQVTLRELLWLSDYVSTFCRPNTTYAMNDTCPSGRLGKPYLAFYISEVSQTSAKKAKPTRKAKGTNVSTNSRN